MNEEMIETLFVRNATNATHRETNRRQVLPSSPREKRVLDPKKSQNIAILMRSLNVTKEEVCDALQEGQVSLARFSCNDKSSIEFYQVLVLPLLFHSV